MILALLWFLGSVLCIAALTYCDARFDLRILTSEGQIGSIALCFTWPVTLPVFGVIALLYGVCYIANKAGEKARR